MKVAVVLGTRPEIIKMSPVIRELQERGVDFQLVHTGQHYSYELDQVFFEQLELPEPDHKLEVGSDSHGEQTGRMLEQIEKVLVDEEIDSVLYQGDTNSVAAAAFAASKLETTGGHVEAGLRSYDRRMPEEHNRVVADHVSDLLFAPTEEAKENLNQEDVDSSRIWVTGNTIVDAVEQNIELAHENSDILEELGIEEDNFVLLTLHRAENVDEQETLQEIISGLEDVSEELEEDIVYPMHPRTEDRLDEFGLRERLESINGMQVVESQPFLDFLMLEDSASVVLTDSGGVQEETCILGTGCVTIRENTERPETVDVGSNTVSGIDSQNILEAAKKMHRSEGSWENPFGDGKSAEKIIDAVEEEA